MAAGLSDDSTGVALTAADSTSAGAISGVLDRLVVEADGGTTFLEVAHQVETAFRNQ